MNTREEIWNQIKQFQLLSELLKHQIMITFFLLHFPLNNLPLSKVHFTLGCIRPLLTSKRYISQYLFLSDSTDCIIINMLQLLKELQKNLKKEELYQTFNDCFMMGESLYPTTSK